MASTPERIRRTLLVAAAGIALGAVGCGDGAAPAESEPRANEQSPAGQGPGRQAGKRKSGKDRERAAVRFPPIRPRALDHGPRDRRRIALTFDADMTAADRDAAPSGADSYDRRVVRKLRRNRVAATMFVTGLWAEYHADTVRKLAADELFEIANHSHDHGAWTSDCYGLPVVGSRAEKRRQVQRTARIIRELTGEAPHWFRFPGLCHDRSDLRLVAGLGHQPVDGDVASGDAFNPDADAIAETVLTAAQPGSIVVMHLNGEPNAPATADALDRIIPELREQGFSFVTLAELFAD